MSVILTSSNFDSPHGEYVELTAGSSLGGQSRPHTSFIDHRESDTNDLWPQIRLKAANGTGM